MTLAFEGRSARSRARLLGACLATAFLFVLLAAAPALAAVRWSITSEHGPQNLQPNGSGQYVLRAYNIGDEDTSSDFSIGVELPPGVTASGFSGGGWSCPDLTVDPIVCTSSELVRPPGTTGLTDVNFRGDAPPLTLTVDVGAGANGTANAVATISGGGAADPASVSDPTTFGAPPTGFGFLQSTFLADAFDAAGPTGTGDTVGSPVRQAGAHPFEVRVNFGNNLDLANDPQLGDFTTVGGDIKTLETRLPAGLIGNPQATPRCDGFLLSQPGPGSKGSCPFNTQVGSADLLLQDGVGVDFAFDVPVYNMIPPRGVVAAFALSFIAHPVWILVTVDPADNYSVVATVKDTTETLVPRSIALSLWGVPGDPVHDPLRLDPANAMNTAFTAPIKPFLTMPSQCDFAGALAMRANSWQDPATFVTQTGTAIQMTGCDDARFQFAPTVSVRPVSLTPSTPTGLDVDLIVPQKDDTVLDATDLYAQNGRDVAIDTPPVRDVRVTLPDGMVVSPSSADGLASCTPAQIALDSESEPACPDASKIGTVRLDTPLLADPLTGDVFLAAQNDNPFGTTLAIYVVASGPGVVVKLPGKVEPDPVTGQLVTTFSNNPQLPFSHLNVHFNDGPRAPLVTPATCGTKTATAELKSWNGSVPAVQASSSFDISANGAGAPCGPRGFDPGFTAGTKDATAGKSSPLVTRFTRADSDEELSQIDVSLPQGLLGRLAELDLCSDAAGNAGTCGDGAKIGTATVAAGPGGNPFYITDGRVYMTGPYKGAPFGLSIVVHAKAGPFDLGNVIVRSAVFVDKQTAALRIVSDPLPTILKGIPLQMRVVDITVDRPGFTFNPTNCSATSSSATLKSTGGKSSTKSSAFHATGCAALPFAPRLSIAVGGRGHVRRGASTPLTATLSMAPGQANLRGVKVTLPTSINARLNVINQACTLDEFHAGNCAKAKAGTAEAVTPLLRDPLRGDVFFVKIHRGLPDMMVTLRGQVDIDLDSKIAIRKNKYLTTDFDSIPDVPVTKFTLRFVSGKQGPVGAAANLCGPESRRARMGLSFTAQNGKTLFRSQRLAIGGCKQATRGKAGGR